MATIKQRGWRRGSKPWNQIIGRKRGRMTQVRVEGHDECWPAVDDPYSGMGVAVNPAFVALGLAKKALQVKVVTGQARIIATDEETRLERAHHLGHLDLNGIIARFEPLGQRIELSFALLAGIGLGVERGINIP